MWNGSEPGWKLVRYDLPVYLVEFHFSDSGPNEQERLAAMEFHAPIRENPHLIDDCPGFAIAVPIGPDKIRELRQLEKKHNLKLTVIEIQAGDYLVFGPNGIHQSWLLWPGIEYRRPVVEQMLEHGVEIVDNVF